MLGHRADKGIMRIASRRPWVVTGLALMLAVMATLTGVGSPMPARADCGMQGPSLGIRPHRGYAVEGVVRSVEGRREPVEGWLYRVTVDVSEMLAGEPVDSLTFDLGKGDCWLLQGDRYKAGDRLIITASGPPTDGDTAYLPDALTWRYEWADHWTLHGLPEDLSATLSRSIREASTRDEIVALVAPDRLPYDVAPGAWRVALARPGSDEDLRDVVPWRDGFVALGGRVVNRHQGPREHEVPTIWISATGRTWDPVASPFPEVADQSSVVSRLVVFRDQLYAVGANGDQLRVWRSDDGERWSPVDVGDGSDAGGPTTSMARRLTIAGAAATADLLVVLTGSWSDDGGSDLAWASPDGRTWSRAAPSGLAAPIGNLSPGPAGFLVRSCVCSGPVERWLLKASSDGVTWIDVGELPSLSYSVVFDDARQRYLAATLEIHEDGDRFAMLDASDDGVTWSRVVTAPGAASIQVGVAASNDTIILLGSRYAPDDRRSLVMVSRDAGATWVLTQLPGARRAECVTKTAIGSSTIVAIGGCAGNLAWSAQR